MATLWPAPAKLNLFLHVVGRRADGYHLLQTAFQFLDYGDEIELVDRADGVVRRLVDLPGVPEESDLAVRAARLLQRHCGVSRGVDIGVHKRLPLGGGLGGGSSDAATVLVALNRIWAAGLTEDDLAGLGLALGADVPVFVRGHAAWAEGIGERLTSLDLEQPWFLVLAPPVTVSTAEVFCDPQLTRTTCPITISDFLLGAGGNDCEAVVRRLYPEVGQALDWLSGYGRARLTGTGACVFCAFADEGGARAALEAAGDWPGFVARGLNESPLLTRLRQP